MPVNSCGGVPKEMDMTYSALSDVNGVVKADNRRPRDMRRLRSRERLAAACNRSVKVVPSAGAMGDKG